LRHETILIGWLASSTPAFSVLHKESEAMTYYRNISIKGRRIFYREAGLSDHPTLLLLHGFPASSFMYRDLLTQLSDRFHLIAPDYPGFGYSDAPSVHDFSYTFDNLSDVIEQVVEQLKLKDIGLYMQDFGGPIGFRLALRNPTNVKFLVVQNANAYEEGLPDSFWTPAKSLWHSPTEKNFDTLRDLAMSAESLKWNYTHGVQDLERVNPDSWALQQSLLSRPGNKEAMLALLYDYRNNVPLYPQWQEYFRKHQPPTLLVWGKNDIVFPDLGAYPYQRDLTNLDFNILDTGHFALEDRSDEIAGHIRRFYNEKLR
jgi:pimeloyl-ACP methyl ester carboxylesterase